MFDFATGSGGFLVEAARRVIDDSGIAADDPKGLREALRAISAGFYGGEISPFRSYLTEINLLLQVSRLLGRMRVAGVVAPPFVLGVLRTDSDGGLGLERWTVSGASSKRGEVHPPNHVEQLDPRAVRFDLV